MSKKILPIRYTFKFGKKQVENIEIWGNQTLKASGIQQQFMFEAGRRLAKELDKRFDIMYFHTIEREDNTLIGLA